MDPKVEQKRYFTFDEMVDYIRDELAGIYLGHAGMEIMKRTRDAACDSTAKDPDGNIP